MTLMVIRKGGLMVNSIPTILQQPN